MFCRTRTRSCSNFPARASPNPNDKQPRPRPKALPILLCPHISQNTSYVFAIHVHFQRQDPIPCSRGRWGFRPLGCHHENQLRLPSRLGAGSAHAVGASLFSLPTFQNPLPVVLIILSPHNTLPGSVWLTMTVQQQLHFFPRWSKKALIRRSLTKTAEQTRATLASVILQDAPTKIPNWKDSQHLAIMVECAIMSHLVLPVWMQSSNEGVSRLSRSTTA